MRKAFFLVVFFAWGNITVAQQARIDSLRSLTKNALADSGKIDAFLELASLFKRGNYDSMYYYGAIAHELSEKNHDRRRAGKSKIAMGYSAIRLGNLKEGMDLCKAGLTIAELNKQTNAQAEALNNIGLAYNYLGDYPTSLEFYQKALSIAETLSNKAILGDVKNNIGGIYYNLKDYDNALVYWMSALTIFQKIGEPKAIGASLSNIGLAYTDKGQYSKALPYYFRSMKKYEVGLGCGGMHAIENIGTTYLRMGKSDSAIFYLSKALHMAEVCKNPVVQMGALTGLAEAAGTTNAVRYLEKAYEIGIQSGLNRETAIAAKSLSDLYEKQGKKELAFSMFKAYHILQDSLYNLEKAKAIGKLEAQYEFELEKKEKEAVLRIDDLNNERKLSQERWIKNTFIVGFIFMLFVAAFTYSNFHRKRLSNFKLRALNKEVEVQKSILISQSEELRQLNDLLSRLNLGLEEKVADRTRQLINKNTELEVKNARLADYAFINAHKLRAPVATMLGLVTLFENKEVDNQERDEIVTKIKMCSVELNSIVKEIQQALEKGSTHNE